MGLGAEMTEAVPPVQEVAFTIGIDGAPGFTVLDLAALHALFEDDFPEFQEAHPLPSMVLGPPSSQTHTFTLGPTPPRVWFISSDLRWLIQIQNDRIALNWRHVGDQPGQTPYPGFAQIQDRFFKVLARFTAWFADKWGQSPTFGIAELTYVDVIPMEKSPGEFARISEIFAFYNATRGAVPIADFTASWGEPIGEPHDPIGWTIVEAKSGVSTNYGLSAFLQTSGRKHVSGSAPSPEWFRELHERAVAIYQSLIK